MTSFPLFAELVTSSWNGRRLASCLGKAPLAASGHLFAQHMLGHGFQIYLLTNGPRGRGEADQPTLSTLPFLKAGSILIFLLLHNLLPVHFHNRLLSYGHFAASVVFAFWNSIFFQYCVTCITLFGNKSSD